MKICLPATLTMIFAAAFYTTLVAGCAKPVPCTVVVGGKPLEAQLYVSDALRLKLDAGPEVTIRADDVQHITVELNAN